MLGEENVQPGLYAPEAAPRRSKGDRRGLLALLLTSATVPRKGPTKEQRLRQAQTLGKLGEPRSLCGSLKKRAGGGGEEAGEERQ